MLIIHLNSLVVAQTNAIRHLPELWPRCPWAIVASRSLWGTYLGNLGGLADMAENGRAEVIRSSILGDVMYKLLCRRGLSWSACLLPICQHDMHAFVENLCLRVFTIPVPIPFRFHFGSDSKIFGSSSLYDSHYMICNLWSSLGSLQFKKFRLKIWIRARTGLRLVMQIGEILVKNFLAFKAGRA